MLKKEIQETNDLYLCLGEGDVRRNTSDKEILEKYANFDNSCLNESKKIMLID